MSWTIDALYNHVTKVTDLILARMDEQRVLYERAIDIAREQARDERSRASEQIDARLAGMNEFRDAMKDQAARFVTRKELWGYLIGAVSLISLIVTLAARFAS